MSNKLYVIDGSSFLFRAYYGIPSLSTAQGIPTNAVYGFVTSLNRLFSEHKPEYVAVCFDRKEPTFRKKLYSKYKANRDAMPEDLEVQIPYIKEIIKAYGLALYELPGFEADDIMGTFAVKGVKEGMEVVLVTSDKDILQLVNKKVTVLNMHKNNLIYDAEKVRERYGGLGPEKVVELMGLMGDSSDNIPGVPGVGEKTAIKLLLEYGSLEGIYQHLDKIKGAIKERLANNRELAEVSRQLVTIDCDVSIPFDREKLKVHEKDIQTLAMLFEKLEFRSLREQLGLSPQPQAATTAPLTQKRDYHLIKNMKELQVVADKCTKHGAIAVDTETGGKDPHQAPLFGISLSFKSGEAYYVSLVKHPDAVPSVTVDQARKVLNPVLSDVTVKKYGQNMKYDLLILRRHGFDVRGMAFDTMVASYLISSGARNHGLDDLARQYLGLEKIPFETLAGERKKARTLDQVPLAQVCEYACEDAESVFQLVPLLKAQLQQANLEKLFNEVEMPLVSVLAETEANGVHIDTAFLKALSREAEKDLEKLEKKIHALGGGSFNINSPKQVSEILFDKLKLPVIRKTKTGNSTDVHVLEALSSKHELPKLLLEYREITKLKSTYIDALPELVNPETGLVHTSFNQTVTTTGRLSSSDPNFQNIPIKTEAGRRIREAFTPRKAGNRILAADYSQIELRILAHLSGDQNLVLAFEKGIDVHAHTASVLYGVETKEVTPEMRHAAKTINFSVIYGKSAFGLSQDLGMGIAEAGEFIESYFTRYAGVRRLLEGIKKTAHTEGFTTTLLGRRCYFPDINSRNKMKQQISERAAINAPIQGSAADLIKVAMVRISEKFNRKKIASKMILQVHDELVFDVMKEEIEEVSAIVRQEMERAIELKVPLEVSLKVGKNWAETK